MMRNGPDPVRPEYHGLKTTLMAKYRSSLVMKLNRGELAKLQRLLQKKFDKDRTINPEYRLLFMFRLRKYFHEETLIREIAGIEALIEVLRPEDLSP